jgi:hypothetical protein
MNLNLSLSPEQVALFLSLSDVGRSVLITPLVHKALVDVLTNGISVQVFEMPDYPDVPEDNSDPLKELLDQVRMTFEHKKLYVRDNKLSCIKELREMSERLPDLFTRAGFHLVMPSPSSPVRMGLADAKHFVEKHELYLDGKTNQITR